MLSKFEEKKEKRCACASPQSLLLSAQRREDRRMGLYSLCSYKQAPWRCLFYIINISFFFCFFSFFFV